ncbi:galactose mutarotase [Rhodobacter sp. Har01]|uniref:aldose epimerase family protein n=1 Tax=Rhodobacter sp. Har01 TaxID=2883999 RepID=UPI001D060075|nr:aldose epimerase family protein [Rhodobacter sp. Har01]MCB6179877.1 galactose mutarotase [Rhodobacter sp. Har01]
MRVTIFGQTSDGRPVHAIDLAAGTLSVRLLTLGSAVQDLRLSGLPWELTLGLSSVAEYEATAGGYFGVLVGPVANRLSAAQAPIAGRLHRFAANEGPNLLHSGPLGTQARVWTLADASATQAKLTLDLPDGDGGFPGNRRVTALWTVEAPATLRLELTGTTDAPTLMNLANHSYWNLDGSIDWTGHRLRIAADAWLPTGPDGLPTGEIAPAAGMMDFRTARELTPGAPALDHCFCLAPARRALTEVAWLTGTSGVTMTLATTEPGLQVYDGRSAIRDGGGAHEGLALEAQGWPDAPNHPGFPGIEISPEAAYRQTTEWRCAAPDV